MKYNNYDLFIRHDQKIGASLMLSAKIGFQEAILLRQIEIWSNGSNNNHVIKAGHHWIRLQLDAFMYILKGCLHLS